MPPNSIGIDLRLKYAQTLSVTSPDGILSLISELYTRKRMPQNKQAPDAIHLQYSVEITSKRTFFGKRTLLRIVFNACLRDLHG